MTDKIRDARTQDYWSADNVIIDVYGPKIGMAGLAVYACLCRCANFTSEQSFPAKKTLMEWCSVKTEGPINRGIEALVKAGLLSIEPRFRENGSQTSNLYTLLAVTIPEKDTGAGVQKDTPPRVQKHPPLNNPNLTSLNEKEDQTGPQKGLLAPSGAPISEPDMPPEQPGIITQPEDPAIPVNSRRGRAAKSPDDGRQQNGAKARAALFSAIAEVCHVDCNLKRGQINQLVKRLGTAQIPANANEVRRLYGPGSVWYQDWNYRARNNAPPSIEDIATVLEQAREHAGALRGGDVQARAEPERQWNQLAGCWMRYQDGHWINEEARDDDSPH